MKISGSVDLEAGKGTVQFSIFSINIFRTQWLIENRTGLEGDLIIRNRKKRTSTHIKVDKSTVEQTIQSIKNINFTLFTNLDIKHISLKISYGNGDAFKTMLYLGLMRISFYSIMSALKGRQQVLIDEEFNPYFHMRTIKGEFFGIFKLSIADIIYGFVLSKIRKIKRKYLSNKKLPLENDRQFRPNMFRNPLKKENHLGEIE